jgi:hypothetical protein
MAKDAGMTDAGRAAAEGTAIAERVITPQHVAQLSVFNDAQVVEEPPPGIPRVLTHKVLPTVDQGQELVFQCLQIQDGIKNTTWVMGLMADWGDRWRLGPQATTICSFCASCFPIEHSITRTI